MNPALYQLLETYYRKRRLALLIGVAVCAVIFLVGLGWGIASLVDDPSGCGGPRSRYYTACSDRYYREAVTRTLLFTVLSGVTGIICAVMLWPLRELSQAPLIRIFTSRKQDVAWLYPKRTIVRRNGVEVNQIHEVAVAMVDGKRIMLTMTEADVKTTIRLMALEAPLAATGWADETELRYSHDPRGVMESPHAVPPEVVARGNAPSARLVVAPDCPFARVDQGIRYLGFTADALPPAAMPLPGEPAQAQWSGKGMRIAYSFDPSIYLRVLEVLGGDPKQLGSELSGVVGVPVLGAQQIAGMLASADPRLLVLGLRAAEVSGTAADRGAYQGLVERLQGHPDPAVAQAAQQTRRSFA
jgi:hypothetical protein